MASTQYVPVRPRRHEEHQPDDIPAAEHAETEEVIAQIDDLLDEIDSILEEQAVLTNFRQRPGQ